MTSGHGEIQSAGCRSCRPGQKLLDQPTSALGTKRTSRPTVSASASDPKRTSTGSCTASLTDPEAAVSRSCRTAPARRKAHRRQRASAGRTPQVLADRRIWALDAGTSSYWPSFGLMPTNLRDLGQTNRPVTSVAALRLGSIQLRALISRSLETAHYLLDEWDRECGPAPKHNDSASARSRSG